MPHFFVDLLFFVLNFDVSFLCQGSLSNYVVRRHYFCCILEQTPHSGQIGLLRLGTLKGYHTIRLIQFTGSFFQSQNVCQTTSIKELPYVLILQNVEKCLQFCIRISLKTTIYFGLRFRRLFTSIGFYNVVQG